MFNLGYGELLIIVVVGLIIFGPSKIPEFARQCGRAVNMFKHGLREGFEDETKKEKNGSDPS
ncbi:MAG: twin-arginine translocase TatA/TatE family subunit [Elusimicrobia bacterium]|nr:twin-arginine translocase TatA/TatE family subunit [Elusimicrobiota bacterium]